jgi:hypothetical protein
MARRKASKNGLDETNFRNVEFEDRLDPHAQCHNGRGAALASSRESDLKNVVRVKPDDDDSTTVSLKFRPNLLVEDSFDPVQKLVPGSG